MTAVKHIADSHDASGLNTGRAEVLYGTHNGILGQLFLDHMAAKKGWTLKSSCHKGVQHVSDAPCGLLQNLQPFLYFHSPFQLAFRSSFVDAISVAAKPLVPPPPHLTAKTWRG